MGKSPIIPYSKNFLFFIRLNFLVNIRNKRYAKKTSPLGYLIIVPMERRARDKAKIFGLNSVFTDFMKK